MVSFRKIKIFFCMIILAMTFIVATPSKPAEAAFCDDVVSAITAIAELWDNTITIITNFVNEQFAAMTAMLLNAQFEMVERLIEFDNNVREAIGDEFWGRYLPAMKLQTQQLSIAETDQSRAMGSFLDAQSQTDAQRDLDIREVEAHRRLRISDQSCQALSVKDTLTEVSQLTVAIAKAVNEGQINRQNSRIGSISEDGDDAEQEILYQIAKNNFCINGQNGCVASGPNPMGHILNSNFINGSKMTYDMKDPDNRVLMDGIITTFTGTESPPPVPVESLETAEVQEEILFHRNPLLARKSVVNYVMGKQIGGAVGGTASNLQVKAAREGSNINPAITSDEPSKREIEETMRERILSNAFTVGTLVEPEDLIRRQATMKEQQFRSWLAIKDANEERLALLAALLGQKLSTRTPGNAETSREKR